jgi:biopolymer transport protein ExbD
MRFPRHSKIFRGQIDPAAVASVFFVFVIFILLLWSHTFTPGIRIRVREEVDPPEATARLLKVLRSREIKYLGDSYSEEQFVKKLHDQARLGTLPKRLIFDHEPGTDEKLLERVRSVGAELNIGFRAPGTRLELPEFAGFPGTPNPVVVVSINLNGQIFFQHQVIRGDLLQDKLSVLVENNKAPLSVVVQADRDVRMDEVLKVCAVARKAGVSDVTIGTLPPPLQ